MQAISKKISFAGILGRQRVKDRRNLEDPGFLFFTIIWLTVIVVFILFYLWSKLFIVNIGYDISRIEKERKGLVRENDALKLEMIRLKSPERIEEIAKKELGLVYPSREHIVILRD